MRITGASSRASNDGILLDMVESHDGFTQAGTFDFPLEQRGGPTPPGALPLRMWPSGGISGGRNLVADATIGRRVESVLSGAAIGVLSASNNSASSTFRMPLEQLFSGAFPASLAALLRPLRQYTVQFPFRISVAGTATFECGVAPYTVPAANVTLGGNAPGAVWCSRPGVNGGAWMPRYRQVPAGAITDGPDTGVLASGWHVLGIRYTEGPVPKIEWLLDDTPRFTLSGDANMPNPFALGAGQVMVIGYGFSAPAGTTALKSAVRFTVRELSQ